MISSLHSSGGVEGWRCTVSRQPGSVVHSHSCQPACPPVCFRAQMGRTQRNKATEGHIGMLKVSAVRHRSKAMRAAAACVCAPQPATELK